MDAQLHRYVKVIVLLLYIGPFDVLCSKLNVTSVFSARKSKVVQVLAVIPTAYESDDFKLFPDLKKSSSRSTFSAKEINDLPSLLSGYQLEVIPIRVPQCELSKDIV